VALVWLAFSPGTVQGEAQKGFVLLELAVPSWPSVSLPGGAEVRRPGLGGRRCNGVGRHIAHRFVASGETVLDVPAKLSAQVRIFATGNGRKADLVDAHTVALAVLRSPKLVQVELNPAGGAGRAGRVRRHLGLGQRQGVLVACASLVPTVRS
jgi:hypothetical protein